MSSPKTPSKNSLKTPFIKSCEHDYKLWHKYQENPIPNCRVKPQNALEMIQVFQSKSG